MERALYNTGIGQDLQGIEHALAMFGHAHSGNAHHVWAGAEGSALAAQVCPPAIQQVGYLGNSGGTEVDRFGGCVIGGHENSFVLC